ncbi:hypothetical protein SELMODRAFT_405140 [Selaginella moellendorffii]|uniref:Acid phosphatase n=1 Tax=Selaginella moellendorffii TaxID=88036 RepID=D8QYJ1_SELML|nr:acid phosphatase 1 [Selaginella moellendorffii]EFJ35209.1 hypothetical protein SELMODRAFT_405140 [Selaginella moellendorffii]|eukprot:XP_002963338.1 acid phosphatase 1 [Selaginella moellendorffii]
MVVSIILCSLLFSAVSSLNSQCFEPPPRLPGQKVEEYCESFQINAEAGNIREWTLPIECVGFVRRYTTGPRYLQDLSFMADQATKHAQSIKVRDDGRDSWVFDVDETLLSNVAYFAKHNYGASKFNQTDFSIWIEKGKATAIVPMRTLYHKLIKAKWTVYLMSQQRNESQRAITEKNLRDVGYSRWKKLFLSAPRRLNVVEDINTAGNTKWYGEIKSSGGRIQATVGDNWDTDFDPNPFPGSMAFKSPNAMYNMA